MNKLTKREKTLLIVLGIVLICGAGFMLGIKPIMDKAASNRVEIQNLELQISDVKAAVAQEALINKRLTDTVEYVNAEGRVFYNPMYTWTAERHVTKILHDNKVAYHAVSITQPEPFKKPPVEGETVDPEAVVDSQGIQTVQLVIECHTTRGQLNEVLDDFYKLEKKGSISSWTYEDFIPPTPEGTEETDADAVDMIKAMITFNLYSIE